MKRATIKDVARMAKVSVATVSRTLNDPDSVKDETKEKVLHAVNSLEYNPDPVAQALRSNQVKSIGIVVPNITNASMAEMTRGAHEELVAQNYNTVLFNSAEDYQREKFFCEILKNTLVDGVIFITGSGETPPVENLAKEMAVCLIDRESDLENVDQIIAKEREGMSLLSSHLYRLGHRRIALITGIGITTATKNRVHGYKDFFTKVDLHVDENYIVSGSWTMQGAYMATKELLSLSKKPSAVIVSTDTMALGALSAALDSGLRVPEDIAITGFDNSPNSAYYNPPLTTLNYPNYEMGKLAARAILNRLKDPTISAKKIVLPLDILLRRSCGYRLPFEETRVEQQLY